MHRFSRIHEFPPPINQYPLYYRARSIEVVLREGDVLYIPPFWFHLVYSEETGVDDINVSIAHRVDMIGGYLNTSMKMPDVVHDACPIVQDFPSEWVAQEKLHPWTIKGVSHPYINKSIRSTSLSNQNFMFMCHTKRMIWSNFQNAHFHEIPQTKRKLSDVIQDEERFDHHYGVLKTNDLGIVLPNTSLVECLQRICGNEEEQQIRCVVFANTGNVHTSLHYDGSYNMLQCIHGTKRVRLFDPTQKEFLYTHDD